MPFQQVTNSGIFPYSSVADLDIIQPLGGGGPLAGSAVSIGNGIFITAAHNITLSGASVPTGISFNLTLREGFANAVSQNGIQGSAALNYAGYGGFATGVGQDLGLVVSTIPNIPQNSMLIFSDANDAVGLSALTIGYPVAQGIPNMNGEIMWEASGTITGYQAFNDGSTLWDADFGFPGFGGGSGGGVWLTYDPDGAGGIPSQQYLAGVLSTGDPLLNNFEPIGDAYQELAATLTTIFGTNFGASFARNVLISDRDGLQNPTTIGTGFREDIYGSDIRDDVIMGSAGNDTIDGGGGFEPFFGLRHHDIVDYSNLNAGINVDINGNFAASVVKTGGNGTDTLTDIEHIRGTAFSDTFTITALNSTIVIEGFSALPSPQELPDTKNTVVSEDLQGGGRHLSAAQLAAASGVLFNHDDQDTLTIGQALLDAGAAVTYLSDDGAGMVWLDVGGVTQRVSYTGIFHVPEQQEEDYFWGTSGIQEDEGWVGVTDTGGILVDLSGVTQPITNTLLAGISLWNLVDEIAVGVGDVTLDLGLFGVSEFTGGDGVDDIIGGVLDDIFSGNGGDDILDGGAGVDTLDGGLGDDTLTGGVGDDLLIGGAGDDVLRGSLGADVYDGGAGDDLVTYQSTGAAIVLDLTNLVNNTGAAAGDSYVGVEEWGGSNLDDTMTADDSGATFYGYGGDDDLFGGDGDDTFFGALGDDRLEGGGGDDFLAGSDGMDILRGEDGDDVLLGGNGDDQMDGGLGADRLVGGFGDDDMSGRSGADRMFGQGDNDIMTGGAGDDFMTGETGDDIVDGGAGNDDLFGSSGDDSLIGFKGDDVLNGGTGADRLDGGDGTDFLTGGSGADVFAFDFAAASTALDTVFDFEVGLMYWKSTGRPTATSPSLYPPMANTLR